MATQATPATPAAQATLATPATPAAQATLATPAAAMKKRGRKVNKEISGARPPPVEPPTDSAAVSQATQQQTNKLRVNKGARQSTASPTSTAPITFSGVRSNIFCRMVIREKVKVFPREISNNLREVILGKLRAKLEGVCTRHGYIRPASVEIQHLPSGRLEGSSLNGDVVYIVDVLADVCNPCSGHVVPARIVDSNKFGFRATSAIEVRGRIVTIIDTIIARANSQGASASEAALLDHVKLGDDVLVEIMGKTFELGDEKIQAVGRLLQTTSNGRQLISTTTLLNAKPAESRRGARSVHDDSDDEEEDDGGVEEDVAEAEDEDEEDEEEEKDSVLTEEEDDEEEEEEEEDSEGSLSGGSGGAASDEGGDTGDEEEEEEEDVETVQDDDEDVDDDMVSSSDYDES